MTQPQQDAQRAFVDARGCLTPQGLALLREAAPGALPEDLAHHLASCPACQLRALESEVGPRAGGRRSARGVMPSAGRAALLGVAILVAVGLLLWSLEKMVGQ